MGLSSALIAKIVTMAGGLVAILLLTGVFIAVARKRVPDAQSRAHVRRFAVVMAVILAIGLASFVFFRTLGHLTIAFGVLGAGVAFAAQEVIGSVAGWLTILFGQFYAVGDRVELGGIKGDVIEIGILRTRLMEIGQWISADLYNGRIVLVANSFIFKQPVFNYSGQFPYIWDEIGLPIRYDTDPRTARQMLERVIGEVTGEYSQKAMSAWQQMEDKYSLRQPRMDPMVTFEANDNWMQFTACYPVDYRSRRTTKNEVFTRILEEVEASGGKISIASSTSQIVQPSSIDVILRQPEKA